MESCCVLFIAIVFPSSKNGKCCESAVKVLRVRSGLDDARRRPALRPEFLGDEIDALCIHGEVRSADATGAAHVEVICVNLHFEVVHEGFVAVEELGEVTCNFLIVSKNCVVILFQIWSRLL